MEAPTAATSCPDSSKWSVLCPVSTILFGVLHKAQASTCAFPVSLIIEAFERKKKPLPGSEKRFIARAFAERPFKEVRVNVALVAKFLMLESSAISRKLLLLLAVEDMPQHVLFEICAVALGLVRAIQRNDMEHSTAAKQSIAGTLAETKTDSPLSYIALSRHCPPSQLGSVPLKLPPSMAAVAEEVEARVFHVLSTTYRYRDEIFEVGEDQQQQQPVRQSPTLDMISCIKSVSSPSESVAESSKNGLDPSEEQVRSEIKRDNRDFVRRTLFDSATGKRFDAICFLTTLSSITKERLAQDDEHCPGMHYLLSTFA